MDTIEIGRDQWKSYFDNFSREHRGEVAILREIGPDIGDQIQADNRAFVGISSDAKDGEGESITVMLGDVPGDTIEHVIASPERVFVRNTPAAATVSAVEIEEANGPKLILELHLPLALT